MASNIFQLLFQKDYSTYRNFKMKSTAIFVKSNFN
jgi:hypothetical protein